MEFKDYKSKPVIRRAHEVTYSDIEDLQVVSNKPSTSVLSGIEFKHYVPVNVGDFIVYLDDTDVYHCERSVFEQRNEV